MSSETAQIICPECGKPIAAAGELDDAIRCRCAERSRNRRSIPPPEQAKSCYVCGVSLQGRKRFRDKVGRYWCYECTMAEERAKQREQEHTCPDCSRVFPPDRLFEYGDQKLCRPCYKRRIEKAHKKLIRMSIGANEKKKELNRIKWMAILVGILLILGTLAQVFG